MTKKKKPKTAKTGRAGSSSPSSSSSQSPSDSKQTPAKTNASCSPVNLDLAAAIEAGSVNSDLAAAVEAGSVNSDLAAAVLAGSVTHIASDLQRETSATEQISSGLQLETCATVQTTSDETPPPAMDSGANSSLPVATAVDDNPETPVTTNSSEKTVVAANPEDEALPPTTASAPTNNSSNTSTNSTVKNNNEWVGLFKGKGKKLEKKGSPFTLPSGELCIKIPNSVIEMNKKSWESFVIGQFYSDPPEQGLIHNIVNGIWSKQYRDITVSKLEGNAFLFRIPNAATRQRVINQRLWQIEGQTMFVAHWEPGNLPEKPALTSAPIWLELRNVPLQFFNEDGLERIAGLVGDPKVLHPSTANKTILDVAKVLTIIDPRKPLPEAVNVQFDSGDICRVTVSSPWMPHVCSHCKEIGHTIKHCPAAPITCARCKSSAHSAESCPRSKRQKRKNTSTPRSPHAKVPPPPPDTKGKSIQNSAPQLETGTDLGTAAPPATTPSKNIAVKTAGTSALSDSSRAMITRSSTVRGSTSASVSEAEPDSSDISSSDSEAEEGQYIPVRTKRRSRGGRGKGPKKKLIHF